MDTDEAAARGIVTERSTAYHEAGHAVVRKYLGLGVKRVTIAEDDEALGRAQYHPPGERFVEQLEVGMEMDGRVRRRIENEIMCGWAGVLAEERLGESDEIERSAGSQADREAIRELAWRFHRGSDYEAEPFIEWLYRRTEGLLAREVTWAQVEAVAEALLIERTLSGRRVREVIQQVFDDWLEARRAESPAFSR